MNLGKKILLAHADPHQRRRLVMTLAHAALRADCSRAVRACSATPAATALYRTDLAPLAPTDIATPAEPTFAAARLQGFQITPPTQLFTKTEPTSTVAAHQR